MRRRFALAALPLALAVPAAVAQTTPPAPVVTSVSAVPSDSLLARAGRAEAAFLAGRSAELRALSDSAFLAALTDEAHQQVLGQITLAGGVEPTGDWEAFEVQGMQAYRRPYALAGMGATFLVVFDAEGRVAGLAIRPNG